MKFKITKPLVGAFILLLFSSNLFAKSKISVDIINIESNEGQLIVYLHNTPEFFPMEKERAYKVIKSKIKNNKAYIELTNIPDGEYAIAVHHDENGNDEVDTNFLGIPNEDFGASNNAKGFMGPPSFKDASFKVLKDLKLTIDMD